MDIKGDQIFVHTLDGSLDGMNWITKPHDANPRFRSLEGSGGTISGSINGPPESFVRQGLLELMPMDFPRSMIGGIYRIEPVGADFTSRVAMDVID